jgi:hypothetical protein
VVQKLAWLDAVYPDAVVDHSTASSRVNWFTPLLLAP